MKYLKLIIKNTEPLSISDDSTSQSGQTNCCRYIPGSTIRGYIISELSNDQAFFDEKKKELFSSKIAYLNGYPSIDGSEMIPSLKGFYESKKADGNIQNVVINGNFDDGMKRAALGRFCCIDGETIKYCSVETDSNMKIQISGEDQKVFRGEAIIPGYTFVSYITFDDGIDETLVNKISEVLSGGRMILGNGRSQGFGKCIVRTESCESNVPKSFASSGNVTGSIYMILLSNTVMRDDNGTYSGLNLEELASKMGVQNLRIAHCSTSTVKIHGYNKTLGIKLPTVPMYEQGSVFKFEFDGTLTKEKIQSIQSSGIGERQNEGFGRVLFIGKEYENIKKKKEFERKKETATSASFTDEDKKVIRTVARNYYRRLIVDAIQKRIPEEKERLKMTKSQAGTVLSILENNRYNSGVTDIITKYFAHADEKENKQNVHKERASIRNFSKAVTDIVTSEDIIARLGLNKSKVMGVPVNELLSPDEKRQIAVAYAIDLIKYAGKEG